MNISKVHVELSSLDVLSVIHEFVKLDGIFIDNIEIEDEIIITGKIKNKVSLDYKIAINYLKVIDGRIICRISTIKVNKLGLFRPLRSLIIKYVINMLEVNGIERQKDSFIVDINKLLFNIPFVELKLDDIFIKNNMLSVDVNEVNISIQGTIIKEEEKEEEIEEEIISNIKKIDDNYSKGRSLVKKKIMPSSNGKLSEYIFIVPDIISLIYRLLKDKRVKLKTKLIIGASIAYVATPNNIVPNKIPFIGKIDDLAVIFFAVNTMVNDVDINVLLENWQGEDEFILILRNSLDYIINYTGAANVQKLCSVIEELSTL